MNKNQLNKLNAIQLITFVQDALQLYHTKFGVEIGGFVKSETERTLRLVDALVNNTKVLKKES